jgi:hypothetical protein
MEYEFSVGSLVIGILIVIAGAAFMRWHQVIADNFGSGVSSYERFKLWALITCVVGFVVALNLHVFILGNLLQSVFNANN